VELVEPHELRERFEPNILSGVLIQELLHALDDSKIPRVHHRCASASISLHEARELRRRRVVDWSVEMKMTHLLTP
jgi:hypothetical protein